MYTKFMQLPKLQLLLLLMVMSCAWGADEMEMAGSSRQQEKVLLQEPYITLDEATTQPLPNPHHNNIDEEQPHTREQLELLRHLKFEPPAIDFGNWPMGQAVTQTVTLFNQHANRTVQLNAVTGPSPIFYSSSFGAREVQPQGNTTFSVVFLPRQIGAISTGLLIRTSFGRTEFSVSGAGSESPYRLKPLVGIKAPMNATLTPEIHMYNPHERPLQILEVYSSGGLFQLELPSGVSEAPQQMWQIPPHTLKPVIRVSFHGRTAGNHSAYIRIKIAEQASQQDLEPHLSEHILVIPVEFEILPKLGVYVKNPLVDFGRVPTEQQLKPLSIKLDLQQADAVQPQRLIASYMRDVPGLSFDPDDCSIMLDARLIPDSGVLEERLVLAGEDRDEDEQQQQPITVVIRAELFKGSLDFNPNVTLFITSPGADEAPLETTRTLLVRNNFSFPLLLYNLSLTESIDATQLALSSALEQEQLLLQPGDAVELLQLQLLNPQARFKTRLRIASNVTQFELPLVACSGRLHVSTQAFQLEMPLTSNKYGLQLNLGTVPYGEMSRSGYIMLRNDNPMPIPLTNWYFKPPKHVYFHAFFMGCNPPSSNFNESTSSAETVPTDNSTAEFQSYCREIGEGETAVFKLSIQTYVAEESSGTLKVWTPYELIRTTVRFKASVGQLDIEQEQLQFKSCFPGKICSAVLSIRSSLTHAVHVKSVRFRFPGLRFKDFNAKGTTIFAQTVTKVGRIYFEPSALCRSACYIKPSNDDHTSIFPGVGVGVGVGAATGQPNNNLLYDGVEVRQRTELYRQFKRQLHSMSLTLHSEELPPLELDFSIGIEWPKLVQHQPFPPTPAIEVGQVQRQWITMHNPTTQPLLLDYYLSDPAYARRTQLSLPHEVIDVSSSSCYLTDQHVFSLPDAPFSAPVLLPAGATLTIPVQFSSQHADKYCTLLHVRSNLTLYEAVWLTARAVQSQFRFGNRRPGSSTPLLFEFQREQFAGCDGSQKRDDVGEGEEQLEEVDSHTVISTRSFTARNAGLLPIRIEGFLIGKQPCEAYGFRVHDCSSFELLENETRKVEISFSTDFTALRVRRTLTLLTNLSYDISYQLLAELPAESLERCAASMPRPHWELALRNAALVILLASFCLVLLAAAFDARAIMAQQSSYDAARFKSPVQPTFNLRNIVKLQAEEVALKTEQQQQKHKNGQLKELKKRTTNGVASGAGEKVASSKKPKSWTSWAMNIGGGEAASSGGIDVRSTSLNPQPKPTNSPKASKKSTAPTPTARIPKKTKTTPEPVTPKPKLETEPDRPKPKVSPVAGQQQENISPKPNKSPGDAPKERVLKEQNGAGGSVRKLGKTPGRERRKEQKVTPPTVANSKKSVTEQREQRKPRQKQLNFNGNPSTGSATDNIMKDYSHWETSSGCSYRDMVKTPLTPLDNSNSNWSQGGSDCQLGPIGSRKSCTATAVNSLWGDALLPPETSSNPLMGSLFSGLDTQMDLTGLNDLSGIINQERQWSTQEQMQILAKQLEQQRHQQQNAFNQLHSSDLCGNLNNGHQWQTQEQLQLMMQHLERQQRQQLAEDQLLRMSNMEGSNWPMGQQSTSATSWSPLGYSNWPSQSGLAAAVRTSPTHTLSNGAVGGVGVIRPPPGLESHFNSNIGAGVGTGQANFTNHIDAQEPLEDVEGAETQLPRQYDPFTSPSSIWSDNWRQRNNHMN